VALRRHHFKGTDHDRVDSDLIIMLGAKTNARAHSRSFSGENMLQLSCDMSRAIKSIRRNKLRYFFIKKKQRKIVVCKCKM
jgi:hypothetical protein